MARASEASLILLPWPLAPWEGLDATRRDFRCRQHGQVHPNAGTSDCLRHLNQRGSDECQVQWHLIINPASLMGSCCPRLDHPRPSLTFDPPEFSQGSLSCSLPRDDFRNIETQRPLRPGPTLPQSGSRPAQIARRQEDEQADQGFLSMSAVLWPPRDCLSRGTRQTLTQR